MEQASEMKVIGKCDEWLQKLPFASRMRVIRYLADKHSEPPQLPQQPAAAPQAAIPGLED